MHYLRLLTRISTSTHTISSFFSNNTAPPDIYTLSLHDALPISRYTRDFAGKSLTVIGDYSTWRKDYQEDSDASPVTLFQLDRKSTRLNSSHLGISYAVFCLKKKKKKKQQQLSKHR